MCSHLSCTDRVKIEECLVRTQWGVPHHVWDKRTSSVKGSWQLARDLLALARKQCRLVTELLTGHHNLGRHLHTANLWDESSHNKLRLAIEWMIWSVVVAAADFRTVLIKQVLALALTRGLLKGRPEALTPWQNSWLRKPSFFTIVRWRNCSKTDGHRWMDMQIKAGRDDL